VGIFSYYPENNETHDRDLDKKIFRHSLIFASFFVVIFWIVRILESLFGFELYQWGILPRHIHGLWGILFSPFIHADFNHLISNTIPFFILLFALIYFYRRLSYGIFFLIYFLSGLCVWLGGRESWHIGASGIVYGLAAFHFVSGVIRNDLRLLIISAVVVFLYGGMVWGILPLKPEVSWESHLWGAASGVLLAIYFRRYALRRRKFEWEEEPEEETENNTTQETPPEEIPPESGKSNQTDWWN
jgi:membrane associated rhomboid family serine protease